MRKNNVPGVLFSMLGPIVKSFGFVLIAGLANATLAYTLVYRDGHTIEVPTTFVVTRTTVTYEAAPGINRTLQLSLIDVAATEKANSEAPGGFFKHGEPDPSALGTTHHAEHTLTNDDLEPIRLKRIQSEQNYEKRRIELGLPSIEETRRRQAVEEEATLELARARAVAQANDETYWRNRAGALRNEIVTVDAEINYLSARRAPVLQVPLFTQGFAVRGVRQFGGQFGGSANGFQPGAGRAGTQGVPVMRSRGMNMDALALRPSRPGSFGFPRAGFGSSQSILPFVYYDNSYDLSIRINDLLQRRAALDALWRELENEARRARVPQVWLMP